MKTIHIYGCDELALNNYKLLKKKPSTSLVRPERLLRVVRVHYKFRPTKLWMREIEPLATRWEYGH